MSCMPQKIPPIPEQTASVAHQAFPKGTTAMNLRDELGSPYEDEDFKSLFGQRGQPGQPPGRPAMIAVMQYIGDLSDRQAADEVRGRIDWKYALSLELDDPGIDASVLSEFRQRLVRGGVEQQLLDKLLARAQERCEFRKLWPEFTCGWPRRIGGSFGAADS
ncbi:transposase [Synechococcus sp. PCC 7336]|uniref:transposase n=1 Tax=Synechococcus sp. PCC 7336 TaxID=195250 RepID=UPI00034B6B51|nr:transposase [Synechococcus sp. PCC 7336]